MVANKLNGCARYQNQSAGQRQNIMSKDIKVSDPFRKTVLNELTRRAEIDSLFEKSFQKPNKNIDDCISYILNTVEKSGVRGFTDDEVFSMACHYYDEDDIEPGKPMKCKVIVNHTIELTEEEIKAAKKEAHDEVVNAEMNRLRASKPVTKKAEETNTLSFEF